MSKVLIVEYSHEKMFLHEMKNDIHCKKMSFKKTKRSKWSVSLQLYSSIAGKQQENENNLGLNFLYTYSHCLRFFIRMNEWIWIKIETLDFDNQLSRAKHEKIYSFYFLFHFLFILLTHFPFPCSFSFLLSSTRAIKAGAFIEIGMHVRLSISLLHVITVPSQSQGLMSIVISQNIHTPKQASTKTTHELA